MDAEGVKYINPIDWVGQLTTFAVQMVNRALDEAAAKAQTEITYLKIP